MNNEISFVCLKSHERDFFVSRISCGYFYFSINDIKYKYIQPNKDIILEANDIYQKSYNESLNGTAINNEIKELLIKEYGWKLDNENFLLDFNDNCKELKINLYKNMYHPFKKEFFKKNIRELEKEYNRLFNIKNTFHYMTPEGISESNKWSFIVNHCIYRNSLRQSFSMQQTKRIVNIIWENYITDNMLRDLCKHEPWSNIWYASQGRNLFKGKYTDYSNEQLRLISWSRMYDNIRKSAKPPSEDVITDDDILDGWLALNAIEREKERNIADAENRIGNKKIRNSQEVFIPVSTREEFKKIEDLNSGENKVLKKDMLNKLKGM